MELFESLFENGGIGTRSAEVTIAHEYFHVHQHAHKLYLDESKTFAHPKHWEDHSNFESQQDGKQLRVKDYPGWWQEGAVDLAGYLYAAKMGLDGYAGMMEMALEGKEMVVDESALLGDIVLLEQYEYRSGIYESSDNPNNGIARFGAYSYTGGMLAFLYLWDKSDNAIQGIMIDLWKNYAEAEKANPYNGYKDVFKSTFGINLDDFYLEFDAFMQKDVSEILAILPSNEKMKAARWSLPDTFAP